MKEPENIKAVIFDLDGTLIDSVGDITHSLNYLRGKYDLPPKSLEDVRSYIGNGIRALIQRGMEGIWTEENLDSLVKDFRAYYNEHCVEKTVLKPGVAELLDAVEGKVPMGVVTNKAHDSTMRILDAMGLSPRFEYIIGAGVIEGKLKPDPAPLLLCCEKLHVETNKALYVGDLPVDHQTALNAGVFPAIVAHGAAPVETMKDLQGGALFESADMLSQWLLPRLSIHTES